MGGGDTILAILAKVMSPFAGPLLSIFLLGMLSRRATSGGVLAGAILGAGFTAYVTYFTNVHWIWYFVAGSFGTAFSGYLISILWPPRHREPAPAQLTTSV
jgi:Na+/proline symporter